MRFERSGLDLLMFQIDLSNTVNGGMVQTTVNIEEFKDEYVVDIKAPGISADHLKLKVNNKVLMVINQIDYEISLSGNFIPLNQILSKIALAKDVKINAIDAVKSGSKIMVFMPKGENDGKTLKNRDIEIK